LTTRPSAQFWAVPAAESGRTRAEAKSFVRLAFICLWFQNGTAGKQSRNYNVFYILPVTPLRTIDLEGKKNSNPLFSGFCAERERFF
jgi:hypothetical protein